MSVATHQADDSCRLAVRVDGPAGGAPVVLLHALGTGAMLWDGLVPALAASHRAVRLDFRGHGGSDATPHALAIDRLGCDVLSVMDAHGIAAACVAGVSVGGLVALWLGIHAPERVSGLVLANTAARIGDQALWDARLAAVRDGGLAALADGTMTRWFTAPFRAAHADVEAAFRRQLLATSTAGYSHACAILRDTDLRPDAARVTAPTVVIGGDEDVATPPADAAWLAATIPGAALHVLPAAHLSNVERPGEFLAAMQPVLGA